MLGRKKRRQRLARRRGVVHFTNGILVEVEEIERIDQYSRLKILSMSGQFAYGVKGAVRDRFDGLYLSEKVEWFSQDGTHTETP